MNVTTTERALRRTGELYGPIAQEGAQLLRSYAISQLQAMGDQLVEATALGFVLLDDDVRDPDAVLRLVHHPRHRDEAVHASRIRRDSSRPGSSRAAPSAGSGTRGTRR